VLEDGGRDTDGLLADGDFYNKKMETLKMNN
jgi:hypothetical protein